MNHKKILIIGSGPAGYSAAIYAARAGLKPLMISGLAPGGQLTTTTDVENYPGFADTIQGPWLMEEMLQQAQHAGIDYQQDIVTEIDFLSRPLMCKTDNGHEYSADAVIIATGAQARWLGVKGEEKLKGFGVSACAVCDGMFFRKQKVAVIGGGNSAVEEALYLSRLAQHVTLIHRRDSLRAEHVLQERLFKTENIDILWNKTVDEMVGEGTPLSFSALRLKDTINENIETLPYDGVFVAIGHDPATSVFRHQIKADAEGYIITNPGGTKTNCGGVFAAGDVCDKIYRQAVTAAGMGCMAALDAGRYLEALA